jgi:alpha-amylase
VTLAAPVGEATPYRDFSADGDNAVFKIDEGLNLNGNSGVDYTTPGSVVYGFEEFTTTKTPGYIAGPSGNIGTGTGAYSQTIDTTQLSEGRHYITARAFRERSDGGPAIFTDFRETIYVDRLPPEPQIVSFAPFATQPNIGQSRDLIVKSVDGTANAMHFFLNLPASFSDTQVRQFALQGQGQAFYYDRDQWVNGFLNLVNGNNVATIVTFEPTGNYSVRRIVGLSLTDARGRGLGDMNVNYQLDTQDITLFRNMLYAQNTQFTPMADVTADGRIDNRDLFALDGSLGGASQAVWDAYDGVLRARGDFDTNGQTTAADYVALRNAFGSPSWLYDLNVDGAVSTADLQTFIAEVVRSVAGDFNFDGAVDASDYTVWRDSAGGVGAALVADGDFDGDVDSADLAVWSSAYGFLRATLPAAAAAAAAAVPEPRTIAMLWLLCAGGVGRRFFRFSKG